MNELVEAATSGLNLISGDIFVYQQCIIKYTYKLLLGLALINLLPTYISSLVGQIHESGTTGLVKIVNPFKIKTKLLVVLHKILPLETRLLLCDTAGLKQYCFVILMDGQNPFSNPNTIFLIYADCWIRFTVITLQISPLTLLRKINTI